MKESFSCKWIMLEKAYWGQRLQDFLLLDSPKRKYQAGTSGANYDTVFPQICRINLHCIFQEKKKDEVWLGLILRASWVYLLLALPMLDKIHGNMSLIMHTNVLFNSTYKTQFDFLPSNSNQAQLFSGNCLLKSISFSKVVLLQGKKLDTKVLPSISTKI